MNTIISSIPFYLSKHISDMVSSDPSIINLSIGEPFFEPPTLFYQNLKEIVIADETNEKRISNKYSDSKGAISLRNEIAIKYKKSYNCHINPLEEILITHGACEAIWLSILTLTSVGDEVIIADPSYMLYETAVNLLGRIPKKIPTSPSSGFCLATKDVENAITDKTKLIIINSPENPTGAVYPRRAIREIHDLSKKYNIQFVHDEVYDAFIFNGQHENIFRYQTEVDSASILINSFSKKFSMMGWRLGWTIGTKEYIKEATKIHTNLTLNLSSFYQDAAATILNDSATEKFLESNLRALIENINVLKAALTSEAGFRLEGDAPKGAFFLFPNISVLFKNIPQKHKIYATKGECVAQFLLEEYKVAVLPGKVYGKGGDDYIRLVGAVEYETVQEAAKRFGDIRKIISTNTA